MCDTAFARRIPDATPMCFASTAAAIPALRSIPRSGLLPSGRPPPTAPNSTRGSDPVSRSSVPLCGADFCGHHLAFRRAADGRPASAKQPIDMPQKSALADSCPAPKNKIL